MRVPGKPRGCERPGWSSVLLSNTDISGWSLADSTVFLGVFEKREQLHERGNSQPPVQKVFEKVILYTSYETSWVFVTGDTGSTFLLVMDCTRMVPIWGIIKEFHSELMVLGRLRCIPLIMPQRRGCVRRLWSLCSHLCQVSDLSLHWPHPPNWG